MQSSVGWNGEASLAVDGILNDVFWAGSCTHTAADADEPPWWAVELVSSQNEPPMMVVAVRVLGRGDCCASRMDAWEVRVGLEANPWMNPKCGFTQPAVPEGSRRTVY